MFELGFFCVILIAAGYWTALWLMGRHDDVIHGKFVRPEDGSEFAMAAPTPAPPPFPKRQVKAMRPANDAKRVDSAALQSLLAAIQQDLKDVA